MTGKRMRLDDDERIYIIDLINENTKIQGSLISLSIRKLLKKLGDDTPYPQMARSAPKHPMPCQYCDFVARNGAGLSRHIAYRHSDNRQTKEGEGNA